jgi:hypothetical protein
MLKLDSPATPIENLTKFDNPIYIMNNFENRHPSIRPATLIFEVIRPQKIAGGRR